MAQHGDVVASVAEGKGVLEADAEVTDDFVHAALLGIAAGGDVDKGRMPAAHLATGERWQHFRLLRFVEEGCQLEDFLVVDGFVEGRVGDGDGHFEVLVEDLAHAVVGLADADVVFAHHDAGNVAMGAVAGKRADVLGRYGAFVDHLIAHKAVGSVHGDVAVYQPPTLQGAEVGDDDARAAGGDEDAVAPGLGGSQCLDGRGGYFVGAEADERSVDVEKQSFGHTFISLRGTKLKILGGIFGCILVPFSGNGKDILYICRP